MTMDDLADMPESPAEFDVYADVGLPPSQLREHFRKQIAKAVLASSQVGAGEDPLAVKNVRVALRRIRSLLRLLAPLFPKGRAEALRKEMRNTARALGSLRDDEVMAEALAELAKEAGCLQELKPWLAQRHATQAALRVVAAERLATGEMVEALQSLWGYCRVPSFGTNSRKLSRLAHKAIWSAQQEVERGRHISPHDMLGLHDLRLCYKRLRYAIEPFRQLVAPEIRPMRLVAKHMQTRLGEIHDLDLLLELVRRDPNLPTGPRVQLGVLIQARRRQALTAYLQDIGRQDLVLLAEDPPEAAAEAANKPGKGGKKTAKARLPQVARQPKRRAHLAFHPCHLGEGAS